MFFVKLANGHVGSTTLDKELRKMVSIVGPFKRKVTVRIFALRIKHSILA